MGRFLLTHVSFTRCFQLMLSQIEVLPHEPHPSEKDCRLPTVRYRRASSRRVRSGNVRVPPVSRVLRVQVPRRIQPVPEVAAVGGGLRLVDEEPRRLGRVRELEDMLVVGGVDAARVAHALHQA